MVECKHFFVFGEKKEVESCLGTHQAQCKHCLQNLFERLPNVITDKVKLEEPEGKHVPLPNGEFEYHFHCWEPIPTTELEKKDHPPSKFQKWECWAAMFDREEQHPSGATVSYRKVCEQTLFLPNNQ